MTVGQWWRAPLVPTLVSLRPPWSTVLVPGWPELTLRNPSRKTKQKDTKEDDEKILHSADRPIQVDFPKLTCSNPLPSQKSSGQGMVEMP